MIKPVKDDYWYNIKSNKPYLIKRVWFKGSLASSVEIENDNKKYLISINDFYNKFRFTKE